MRFGDYPNKRPIEDYLWSNDIPSHWQTIRLGFLIEMLVGNAFSSEKFEFEGGTRLVRGDNVTEGRLRWGDKQRCWPEITRDIEKYLLADGDVLIGMDGSKVGKNFAQIRQEDLPLLLVQRVARLRSSSRLYPSYLRYLIGSPLFLSWVEQRKTDPMVPHITAKDICNYRVCCPKYEEQKGIARFLDFKTAQIDALIAKKKSLLDKLAEKRTALISHAVTKGLNPSVPMKDSDVHWLGKIPAHWKITRIKFVARIGNGSTPSRDKFDYWVDGYFPWLNSSVVNQEEVTESDQFVTDLALKECHLPIVYPPAVLVGITGQGKTRGMASKLSAIATINQHLAYIKPTTIDISVDYLLFLFERAYSFLRSESDGGGSTKGAITCEQIANLEVPLPPTSEQASIAVHVADELEKLRDMNRRVSTAVEKLQEYRSTLITNAVTGKIDVREFQVPGSSTAKEVAHA